MKKNIVLIGMPGVGKSTIGVIIAKILGYQFIDADLVIQEQYGKLLKEIIAERGTDGFVQVENDVNKSLNPEKAVISTGGSVVYCTEAMEHLSEIATIVYLKLDLYSLERRLGNLKQRGGVLKEGQTLKDLYDERCPLYEKYADIVISENHCSVEKTVDKVVTKLRQSGF